MHDKIFSRGRHPRGLRNACRTALCAAIAFFCALPLTAQNYPNSLAFAGVDPEADSLAIAQIRARLNEVRKSEGRPVVGLVLSGGGAKGAAEVGVMKFLEELDIPVDFVCGTSIGGLLGAMKAMGYSAADMEKTFQSQDWDCILYDKMSDKYIPYATKMYKAKYIFSIPFHYNSEMLSQLGATEDEETSAMSLISASLPSGITSGMNVSSLISSLTVGYQDSLAFSTLPIPYLCNATDMVTGRVKLWGDGSLKSAMRSTMSIPGLFQPVRDGKTVLVDGGIRNNFAIDFAEAVGCDFIIGVAINSEYRNYDQINNLGQILGQGIDLLGIEAYGKNEGREDILIRPDISGYSMLSFNNEAIEDLEQRGYEAAVACREDLEVLKQILGGAGETHHESRAIDISKQKVTVGNISFEGISDADGKYLLKKIGIKAGTKVGKAELDDALGRIKSTGAFESIEYSLYGTEEPYQLVFKESYTPSHRIGLGFRIDTEEWASVLFNIGLNSSKLTGPKADFSAKIGQNFKTDLNLSVNPHWMPAINFRLAFERYKGDLGLSLGSPVYGASYRTLREELYLSDIKWTNINFKLGIRNQYFGLDEGNSYANLITQQYGSGALNGDYFGAFVTGDVYTFDNYYYPTKGIMLKFNADYDFLKGGSKDFKPILSSGIDFRGVIPAGRKFAIIPEFHARNVFRTGDSFSAIHSNFVGGMMAGRYMEKQIPFFGLNNVVATGDMTATMTLDLRLNPLKNFYTSVLAGYLKTNETLSEMITDLTPDCWAFGAEVAYNTFIGPLKINLHWSDVSHWGMYASLGFDF